MNSEITEFDLYNPYSNQEVTNYYCSIISESLRRNGCSVRVVDSMVKSKENKNKGIIVVRTWDAFVAKRNKYGRIVLWIQGIAPEETFLVTKNILKFGYVLFQEILGLLSADFIFFCSDYMKSHYKKKFILKAKKYYIMPCFNEEIDSETIKRKDYSKNIFGYVGGLDKWQFFEQIVKTYKTIEENVQNAHFAIFTKNIEEADEMVKRYGIRNYSIQYFPQSQLSKELEKVKFGFCLRDNIEVNRVATPTKLSNYVSLGIIPIISKSLTSFYFQSRESNYVVCADDDGFIDKIKKLCKEKDINEEVLNSFLKTFENYYSREYHIKKICSLFNKKEA